MEVGGITVVAGCDTTKVLQAVEHALDGVVRPVEGRGEAVLPNPVELGRYIWCCSHAFDLSTDGVGIVALVAVDHSGV